MLMKWKYSVTNNAVYFHELIFFGSRICQALSGRIEEN